MSEQELAAIAKAFEDIGNTTQKAAESLIKLREATIDLMPAVANYRTGYAFTREEIEEYLRVRNEWKGQGAPE